MRTTELMFRGVPLTCGFELDEGEPAIYFPTDRAHPGTPTTAVLITCTAGGVDVMPLLDAKVIAQIEVEIVNQLECFA